MTVSDEVTETWKTIPGFGSYEAGDRGHIRSVDRQLANGRRVKGRVLATRLSNQGYVLVNLVDDAGKPRTRTLHTLILLAFAGPCPEGMETLHGKGGPTDNRWPEGIRYGTRGENEAEKIAANGAPVPPLAFRCRNHARCGGMTGNPGRRCRACVRRVGEVTAAMLDAGVNLDEIAKRWGYKGPDWLYELAVEYGGYAGSKRRARSQHPSWLQRVMIVVRGPRWPSDGDAL